MPLAARQVSYTYRQRTARSGEFALRDVSLTIRPGSLTGLLGPNGCGKTTLLKLLSGTLAPDGGSITLDGKPLTSFSRSVLARHVAVVPQETHPAFDFTVLEMVLMGRHPHLGLFQLEGPADVAIARDALAATGVAHLADREFMSLSGGEKQRVVIAGALAQTPRILLLDEPTASLDLGYQLDVAALLLRLNRRRGKSNIGPPTAAQPVADAAVTMIVATHDLNLAASLCDSLVLVRNGRVLAHGPTADVLTRAAVHQLYGVDADVRYHEDAGHLTVTPVRRQ